MSLAPLFYFPPALLQRKVLCPDDGLLQNVPFRVAAAQIIRSGHLPLWNPYIFSGMPLFATAQVGILYPLNWFYVPFSAATATNLMVISTYVVAGLGAYLYARQIKASIVGAVITSLAWQFGGAAIGQISHINIGDSQPSHDVRRARRVRTLCVAPGDVRAFAVRESLRRGSRFVCCG